MEDTEGQETAAEAEAKEKITEALQPLDDAARARAFRWLADVFGVTADG